MLNANTRASERATVILTIDPDAMAAGTVSTPWLDMSSFERLLVMVMVGDMGVGATLDAKIEQATDAAGTGAKDVTGKAITQMSQAGDPDHSDSQTLINLNADELDIAADFAFVRLSITVAAASCDVAAMVFGFDAKEQPHAQAATVIEVI